jgi:hypothetical protein
MNLNLDLDLNINLNVKHYNHIYQSNFRDSINCLYINAQSLRNKIFDLRDYIDSVSYPIHVILLTETWLKETDLPFFNLPGYDVFNCTRRTGTGGGVAIYVLNSFDQASITYRSDFSGNNILVISLLRRKIKFAVIYRKPGNDLDRDGYLFLHALEALLNAHKSAYVFGDFNIDILSSSTLKDEYIRVVTSNGFSLLNSSDRLFPTRVSSNHSSTCIDHVFTDRHFYSSPLDHALHLFDLMGDHKSILLAINSGASNSVPSKKRKIKITNHNRILKAKLIQQIDTNSFTTFMQQLSSIISKNTTEIEIDCSKGNNPYISQFILNLMKVRNRYRKLRARYPLCEYIQECHANYEKLIKREIRKSKCEYSNKLFRDNSHNPKKIWSHINQLMYGKTPDSSPPAIELRNNGIPINSPLAVANVFNHYFINVSDSMMSHFNFNQLDFQAYHNCELYNIQHPFVCAPCTHDELESIIASLKSSPTVDFFGISNKFVKTHKLALIPPVTKLINLYMFQGIFPSVFKIATINPIFKNGEKTNPNNYRPIAMLPVIGKLFEHVIYRRLSAHLLTNDILHRGQFGYTTKSNTEIAAIHILNDIYNSIDQKLCTSLTCIDLSKAFDCLNHSLLIEKFTKLGLDRFFFKLLSSYLSDRQQLVKINEISSNLQYVKCGTPQGGVLSGLFFNLYVNSIFSLNLHGSQSLYCDDNSLVNSAPDPLSLKREIESDLLKIDCWLKFHFLTPNRDKTKYVLFYNTKRSINYISQPLNISFGGHTIDRVDNVKVLGLNIDERLDFKEHIAAIHSKVTPFMFAVRRIRPLISEQTALTLYYSFINSHFTYMASVWCVAAKYLIDGIDVLQRKALRIVMKKEWYCSSSELYSSKILPVSTNAHIASLLFAFKLSNNSIKNNVTVNLVSNSHDRNTRNKNDFLPPPYKTSLAQKNIYFRCLRDYNNLPKNIKSFNSISLYKNHLREYLYDRL